MGTENQPRDVKLLREIGDLADLACQKICNSSMTQACKEKHCPFFNILNNSYWHLEMGWTRMLELNLENIRRRVKELGFSDREINNHLRERYLSRRWIDGV